MNPEKNTREEKVLAIIMMTFWGLIILIGLSVGISKFKNKYNKPQKEVNTNHKF